MPEVIETILDNIAEPLEVPGFHDIPVNVELPQDQFASGTSRWDGPLLTAKELAMLELMNAITERPNWHLAIVDQQNIARWREDAISSSLLIDYQTWYCLAGVEG
ncbi:hypothetical protein BDW75DRAFT_245479 [Aspergillus navahoensis]